MWGARGRGPRFPALRRHRRPPFVGRHAGWLLRAGGLGAGVGAGPVVPRHVGARARSRVDARRTRDWLCASGSPLSVLVDGIGQVPLRFGVSRRPIIGAVAVVLPALAFTGDVLDGQVGTPPIPGGPNELAFTQGQTDKGEFRMLWVGAPSELPLDPVVLRDGTGYVLTPQRSG